MIFLSISIIILHTNSERRPQVRLHIAGCDYYSSTYLIITYGDISRGAFILDVYILFCPNINFKSSKYPNTEVDISRSSFCHANVYITIKKRNGKSNFVTACSWIIVDVVNCSLLICRCLLNHFYCIDSFEKLHY